LLNWEINWTDNTILDFRFWILDWGTVDRIRIPVIEIMQAKAKMVSQFRLQT
jgi:hypothetical protein